MRSGCGYKYFHGKIDASVFTFRIRGNAFYLAAPVAVSVVGRKCKHRIQFYLQVSSLTAEGVNVHWFTATPDPSVSCFKPFVFAPDAQISAYTKSPNEVIYFHLFLNEKEYHALLINIPKNISNIANLFFR